MRNIDLANLNFREIVDYGGQPPVKHRYCSPLVCHGYCISCEQTGVLEQAGGRLDRMSHGCDSEDFEAVLGPMPQSQDPEVTQPIEVPVLFLLSDPGGGYGNDEPIPFNGFKKKPPVNHYYWTPSCKGWPDWPCQTAQFEPNFYGPYFAYLMRRHQLRNVYITNRAKCRFDNGGGKELIVEHCVKRFLIREVEIFDPQMAFCFGTDAMKTFQDLVRPAIPNCLSEKLYHPTYIASRWGTARKHLNLEPDASQEKVQGKLIQMGDDRIQSCIAQFQGRV